MNEESTLENADNIEDAYLAKKAKKLLKEIAEGKEKTVSWDTMKKRVGWNEL